MSDLSLLTVAVLTAGKTSPLEALPPSPNLPVNSFPDSSEDESSQRELPSVEATIPEFSAIASSSESLQLEPATSSNSTEIPGFQDTRDRVLGSDEERKASVPVIAIAKPITEEQPTPEFSSSLTEPKAAMAQVTSIDQLSDVLPSDWAYQALQNLVKRYGVLSGYPDGTFRGDRPISRYEFAAALQATLDTLSKIIAEQQQTQVSQADLLVLERLQANYAIELADLKTRIDGVEARTTQLETQQFSTTTRLFGQAIVGLQGSNQVDVDLFPRDGVPERSGEAQLNLAGNVQLSLATSFTGRDLLLTGLQAGNLVSFAPLVFTNMGRLSTELDSGNDLVLSDLSYRFPLSPNFGVIVGPAGVNAINTFRGINPLEGAGEGAISLLGQRNPILGIGNGTGGIGLDWQVNRRLSVQGVYSAENPSRTGIFSGRTTAGVQVAIAPTNNLDLGLHYLYSHSPDGFLSIGTGDNQLLSPLAPIISPETSFAFNTHAIGATLAWRVNPRWTMGTWGGWTHSAPVNLSGAVETTNWMVFSAFPDLFSNGNLGGILFGQPPKITSSTLPDGFNFPNFLRDLSGTPGGRADTALHLELFYRARVTNNISLTPGVLVIFNPDHNAANDALVIGTLRASFQF
jgi:hypothetical protein